MADPVLRAHEPKRDALVGATAFRAPVTDRAVAARLWEVTAEITGNSATP